MTVQPTHQTADGRKFVKVGELPMGYDEFTAVWQNVESRMTVLGSADSIGLGGMKLTPIPQPEVRWIGVRVNPGGWVTHASDWREHAAIDGTFLIKVSTLNGVRTASVEEP